MKIMGYKYVVEVTEIEKEEAHFCFDMKNEATFPVFGN